MMDNLHITSLNVRGLRDTKKCRELFNRLHKGKYDIALLQEAHSQTSDEVKWSREWGNNILFVHGDYNSRGVCTLISKSCKCKIKSLYQDQEGRVQILEIQNNAELFHIVNIYAPNEDDPNFFVNIFQQIVALLIGDVLICGDFNLVLQPQLDRTGDHSYKPKALSCLNDLMEQQDMIDVWRCQNPEEVYYSWKRIKNAKLSGIANKVSNIQYAPGYKSDHASIQITLNFGHSFQGPGYWKLNN